MLTDGKKSIAALIVAAGRGHRVGEALPKQYLKLAGKPVLRHTVEAFLACELIDKVQVVIHPDDRQLYDSALEDLGLPEPVAGGEERQDSVRLGLEALESDPPEIVLIHDAARPFVQADLISRVVEAIADAELICPALPVTDTLKRVEGDLVQATVPRDGLWRVQTPQAAPFKDLLVAHQAARGQALTDDAAVAEASGMKVRLVMGGPENEKITTAEDLVRAEAKLSSRLETRVGNGFDVHRFGPGESVMLCGIEIPHSQALAGHSDADVALHALTDAILGALGEGDIGQHFPPSDPQWKGAASTLFLQAANDKVAARGGRLLHLDVTIICEAPKIGPHRETMRQRVAELLDLKLDRVSVKATTTEKVGFTGRGEGIAAQATATLELPA